MCSKNKITSIDFLVRGCRRVARIPWVNKSLCVSKDKIGAILFWSNRTKRSAQYADFKKCYHLDEFFRFSARVFGPHQIKEEILSFLEFAINEQPNLVCEIGTADGGTNFLLSQALPSVSFMLGVDLYVKKKAQLCYFSKSCQCFYFINGASYSKRTVDKVKHTLGCRKIDLLFIDGDHSYEGVRQDFLKYRHLVQDGGIIAFHDIIPDYFSRYGIKTNRWVGGVPQFWNKIKVLYPFYEFVEDNEQDGLGIGAIRYSSQVCVPDDV